MNNYLPKLLLGLVVTIANGLTLIAQQSNYGIFDTQDEYYEFMGSVKQEGATNPELMAMVPMINDVVLGRPLGSTGKRYNATNSVLGLLSNESVRKELEMVDDQFADLKKTNAEIHRKVAEQLKNLDLSDMQSAAEKMLAIRDQSEQDLQATLLPHQLKRLRQIAAQNQLRYRTLVEVLTSEPMKSEFEINDDQSEKLKKAEQEIQQELEREIAQLRLKARKKLLSQLRKDQQDEVESWLGDRFEFPHNEIQKRASAKNRK